MDLIVRALSIDKSSKGKLMSAIIKQWVKTNKNTSGKEVAEMLIKNGANVNADDKDGVTPLYLAVSFGKFIAFSKNRKRQ